MLGQASPVERPLRDENARRPPDENYRTEDNVSNREEPLAFGRELRRKWKIPARCYFDKEGTWYSIPIGYPVALCDQGGYALFKSQTDLKNSRAITVKIRIHVKGKVSRLPNYQPVPNFLR